MTFQIEQELLQEVLNYLGSRPYAEVNQLVQKVLAAVQPQLKAQPQPSTPVSEE
jgi:hypothetical protein